MLSLLASPAKNATDPPPRLTIRPSSNGRKYSAPADSGVRRIHPDPQSLLSSSDTSSRSASPKRPRRFRSSSADPLSTRTPGSRKSVPSPLEAEWQAEIERRFLETGLTAPATPSTPSRIIRGTSSLDTGRLSPFRQRNVSTPLTASGDWSPFPRTPSGNSEHEPRPVDDSTAEYVFTSLSPPPRNRTRAPSASGLSPSPSQPRTPSPGHANTSSGPSPSTPPRKQAYVRDSPTLLSSSGSAREASMSPLTGGGPPPATASAPLTVHGSPTTPRRPRVSNTSTVSTSSPSSSSSSLSRFSRLAALISSPTRARTQSLTRHQSATSPTSMATTFGHSSRPPNATQNIFSFHIPPPTQSTTTTSHDSSPPRRTSADRSASRATQPGNWEHDLVAEMLSLASSSPPRSTRSRKDTGGSSSTGSFSISALSSRGRSLTNTGTTSHTHTRSTTRVDDGLLPDPTAAAAVGVFVGAIAFPPLDKAPSQEKEEEWKLDLAIPTPSLGLFSDRDRDRGERGRERVPSTSTLRSISMRRRVSAGSRAGKSRTTRRRSRKASASGTVPAGVLGESSKLNTTSVSATTTTGFKIPRNSSPFFSANKENQSSATMVTMMASASTPPRPNNPLPLPLADTSPSRPTNRSSSRTRSLPLLPSPSKLATVAVPSPSASPERGIKGRGKRMNSEGDHQRPVGRTISNELTDLVSPSRAVRTASSMPMKGILKREGSGAGDENIGGEPNQHPIAVPLKRLRLSYSTPPELLHRTTSSSLHSPKSPKAGGEELTGSIGRAASMRGTGSLPMPVTEEGDIYQAGDEDDGRPWSRAAGAGGRSTTPTTSRARSPSLNLSALLRYNEQQQEIGKNQRRQSQGKIPLMAIITPRPVSASLSRPGSEYFMKDPNLGKGERPGSRATNYSSVGGGGGGGGRGSNKGTERRKVSRGAWLFILGFFIPVFWWGGSFAGTTVARKLGNNTEAGGRGWPMDKDAYGWRRWCRVMTCISIVVYIPVIVLAVVFTR